MDNLAQRLSLAKRRSDPITCTLLTGHELVLTLSSVGAGWFAGQTLGRDPIGVVIPTTSVRSVCGSSIVEAVPDLREYQIPITSMLLSLMRLRKRVFVHVSDSRRQGFIVHVGVDYFALSLHDGAAVITPISALSWLAVP